MSSKINCSKVYVKESSINPNIDGAFARQDIPKEEIIEEGIVRVIDIDGHKNQHVFTWSDEIPNKTWAITSGCATFYNTSLTPNTKMLRDFENNSFRIIALKDIAKDEELTHTYKSLTWRTCFLELNKGLNSNLNVNNFT